MKVAMISDDWWPETGGGPVHVKELSRALAKYHECTVDIYTRALKRDGEKYAANEKYQSGRVNVHRLGPCTPYWNPIGRVTSMITPLPHLLRDNYDIIHGHSFLPAVPTQLSDISTDASTVFTVHGTALTTGVGRDQSLLSGIKRLIEKQFLLGFNYDATISVNNEHVELLERGQTNVKTIPNGVNFDRFDIDVERTQDILYLGRLTSRKRVSDLVDAFSRVESEFPESKLRIVGMGPEQENLKEQAESLGLDNRVVFEGRVSDDAVPRCYASAGLFVLPSVWEGHPLTLLEAWASGTPVIASSVEGIKEFVDHQQTGYLVPPKSPDRLAEGLRVALNNPKKANDWAENGRKLVQDKYSWEGVANQTYKLYKNIS
ncbi:glycosyltransferase family 1 protein [Halogeometricum borinquense]|uniref:Glycosyltransferase family 1 protein n=1 Tax=Halogeometricum borinquense TaxID=60847 RepID=A0A482TC63_9EURY|nr:glycosyltransferase family 4 protein [Halogeometricum borinquense]RYJ08643.1 glycosyltransferase family 1 protein [Halogeometricum borinquense]